MAFFHDSSSVASSDELLQCPGCKENFENLKVLPCSHPFCYDCMLHVAVSLAGRLKCLTCESVHRLPMGGVPAIPDMRPWLGRARSRESYASDDSVFFGSSFRSRSRPLQQIGYKGNKYSPQPKSDDHAMEDSYRETLRSKTERIYGSQSPRRLSNSQHRGGSASSPVNNEMCPMHQGMVLKYLCHTCKVALCDKCQYTYHKNEPHELFSLFEEPNNNAIMRKTIEETYTSPADASDLEDIQKWERELEWRTKVTVSDIKSWADELREEVNRQEEELTNEVLDSYSLVKRQLHERMQYKPSLLNHNGILRHRIMNSESGTSNGHPHHFASRDRNNFYDGEVLIFSANRSIMEDVKRKGVGHLEKGSIFEAVDELNVNSNMGLIDESLSVTKRLHFERKFSVGGVDDPAAKLILPLGVAITTQGEVIAGDTLRGIVVLNRDCKYLRHFSSTDDDEEFEPREIHAIDSDHVAITDIEKCRIIVCDVQGKKKFEFGNNAMKSPISVASSRSGRLFVSDIQLHCVFIYDRNGRYLKKFGRFGGGDGHFKYPWSVVVTSTDDVMVSDYYNHRIQVFDLDGRFKFCFGGLGSGMGELEYPRGMALDHHDNVYVCSNHKVQIFTSDGLFIGLLGDGTEALWYVTGIAVSPRKPYDVVVTHHSQHSLMSSTVVTVFDTHDLD
ncbi:tripartite motif-containing protein 2-like [Ptychodera flava]|uniref:tripartite motif-containing protein 2-like n=1 Tax=Ptychodera flava TaxID=63121 RepID=UPI003969F28D